MSSLQINPKLIKENVLWTNPNPPSVFSAQTISINLSQYKYYEILFSEGIPAGRTKVGNGFSQFQVQDANGNWTGYPFIYMRVITSNSNGITFSDNRGCQTNTNSWSVSNSRVRPLQIIGYK